MTRAWRSTKPLNSLGLVLLLGAGLSAAWPSGSPSCVAGVAWAGTRATDLVKDGVKLLNKSRYAEALGRFQDAYSDDHRLTRTLLLSGVCEQNLGHLAEALTYYERFTQEERTLAADDRTHLKEYLREVQRQLGKRRQHGETLLLVGRTLVGLGQPLEALALYERYERELGEGGGPRKGAAQQDEPERVELHGLYERAVDNLQQVTLQEVTPARQLELLPALVRYLAGLDRTAEAYAAYERLQHVIGGLQGEEAKLARWNAAILEFQREPAGGRPQVLLLLASHALLRVGREREAQEGYERYLQGQGESRNGKQKEQGDGAEQTPYEAELAALKRKEAPQQGGPQAAAQKAQHAQTAQRRLPLVPVSGLSPPVPERKQRPTPVYKKWWFWVSLGAGAATVAGLGALAAPRPTPAPMSANVYKPTF